MTERGGVHLAVRFLLEVGALVAAGRPVLGDCFAAVALVNRLRPGEAARRAGNDGHFSPTTPAVV